LYRHKKYRCIQNPNVIKKSKKGYDDYEKEEIEYLKKNYIKMEELIKEKDNKMNILTNEIEKLKNQPITTNNINYNDIKIVNVYAMKPLELLNKYFRNNPATADVLKYVEIRGLKENEQIKLLEAYNANNIDYVAKEIDIILKNCNRELIANLNINSNTCDGLLFSNDGSCRKHISKDDDKWLYINDEMKLDRAVSMILDRVTLKYNLPMNYVKKVRAQINKKIKKLNDWGSIKNRLIEDAKIKDLSEDFVVSKNLNEKELKERVGIFFNHKQSYINKIKDTSSNEQIFNNTSFLKANGSNQFTRVNGLSDLGDSFSNINHQSKCSCFSKIKTERCEINDLLKKTENNKCNDDILCYGYYSEEDINEDRGSIKTHDILENSSNHSSSSEEGETMNTKKYLNEKNPVFNVNNFDNYIKIMDCSKYFWLDKINHDVFNIKTKEYVGKIIHEENCPIKHNYKGEISEKCWKYIIYK